MRAIIHTRVSSTQQSTDDKVSLDEQADICLAYVESRSLFVEVVREVASAGTVRGRPLLLRSQCGESRTVRRTFSSPIAAYWLTRQQSGIYSIDEDHSSPLVGKKYRVRHGGV